ADEFLELVDGAPLDVELPRLNGAAKIATPQRLTRDPNCLDGLATWTAGKELARVRSPDRNTFASPGDHEASVRAECYCLDRADLSVQADQRVVRRTIPVDRKHLGIARRTDDEALAIRRKRERRRCSPWAPLVRQPFAVDCPHVEVTPRIEPHENCV